MRIDRLLSYADRLRASPLGSDLFIDARGAVAGGFGPRTLGSAFQWIRRPDGTIVGAQGLLRLVHGADGAEPFDWPLFTGEASDDDLVALDRRCRTIHTLNFFTQADDGQSLHLCVHDRLLSAVADNHGRVFRRLVDALGVRSDRIVIDLPASVSADPTALAHVAANYSLSGFRVAVNPPSADVLVNLLDVARISVAKIDAPDWTRFAASSRDATRHRRWRACASGARTCTSSAWRRRNRPMPRSRRGRRWYRGSSTIDRSAHRCRRAWPRGRRKSKPERTLNRRGRGPDALSGCWYRARPASQPRRWPPTIPCRTRPGKAPYQRGWTPARAAQPRPTAAGQASHAGRTTPASADGRGNGRLRTW